MKKKSSDAKTAIIILSVVAVIVLAYIGQDLYFKWSGKLRTEYLFDMTEKEVIAVDGFVVRDENRTEGSQNTSLLKMQSDRIYIPTVTDSTSVAAGAPIAYAFKSEAQAEAYQESQLIDRKIAYLEELQSQENLNYINVVALNSEIVSAVNNYIGIVESNRLSAAADAIQRINYKITTKQIATGTQLDFTAQLLQLQKQKKSLQTNLRNPQTVSAPYAGYFVSGIDGYENAVSFQDVRTDGVTASQVDELMKQKPEEATDAFGKIIGQHTWYFLCNVSMSQLSNLKKGYYVTVSFPDKGIYDVSLRVHSVSDRAGDKVALVLKCTSMNEALSTLRKERAEITVRTYNGFKISNDALREENGLTGVYVLSGNVVVFKPIKILYHADNYVIAGPAVYYNDKGEIDKEKTPNLPQVETYDQVIVKGKNLYDRKVID